MVTVFTPAYNREKLLDRLYQSLLMQTNKDFEWLIVDDGSTDQTKTVVQEWIAEDKIDIRYIYQKNQGKYVAFNTGVLNAQGRLFFCVDSDDYLPTDAIDIIQQTWRSVTDQNLAGIVALKTDTNGYVLNEQFPPTIDVASLYELSQKYHCGGERSLVYRTEILKKYLFPVIQNEKFVTECVVYDKIDTLYSLKVLNEVLTICEYQPDGLTGNIVTTMLKNPTGYKIYYKQRIDMANSFKERFGYAIRYNAFKILSKNEQFDYDEKHKFLVFLTVPVGWLLTKYYYHKQKSV